MSRNKCVRLLFDMTAISPGPFGAPCTTKEVENWVKLLAFIVTIRQINYERISRPRAFDGSVSKRSSPAGEYASRDDLELARERFPSALLLAREMVAWGNPQEILSAANLRKAHAMTERWDNAAPWCAKEARP
jgi:hypothetical protein